jgi:hypothetical protein
VQVDSILAVYNLNELPNSAFDKVNLNIATKRFAVAQQQINTLRTQSTANTNFCNVQQYALRLAQNPNYKNELLNNQSIKNYLLEQANGVDYKSQGLAEAILAVVYNIQTEEERIEPIAPNGGGRLGNTNLDSKVNAEQIELATGISVYPNPANDLLTVKLDVELTEAITIKIIDVTGKVLIEQTCSSNCNIKLNTLQNGIYFVNLFNNTILISTKKIVVIK